MSNAYDAAALRIADRIRSSLEVDEVLQFTVDELGLATGVSRSLIQLAPGRDGVSRIVEWDRGDTRPLGVQPPTIIARRVFDTGEPVVIESREGIDAEARAYLESVGSVSAIALPVRWQSDVMAAIGFEDSVPRDWQTLVLPLLERVERHIGAALAQASLYEHQQAALQQMRDLDRLREELLANVSHELRTPLTAIVGSIKTLRREDLDLDAGGRAEILQVLDEQAERLTALTEDILQLSRYTRGRQALARAPLQVSELVDAALSGLETPDDREIDVAVECDAEVHADRNRMIQVISNLLQNAVRHGEGRITIRCYREDGTAKVAVGDEGPGVPRGYREEMFAPFSHAGGRADSTGLGLSIARAIVEAHGGTLLYRDANGDATHAFEVGLPVAARDEPQGE